ncbi:serine protease 55-like [Platysternon megacephalum]|uniref:Serine protease 55-like n=1 Tax=Platysternon megacephalum TaxID=55544 RepID=A0A4D9DU01_9SAUR|nr:serine protease 55-like [Platysternon megacephalum]
MYAQSGEASLNLLPVQKTEEEDRLHWRYAQSGEASLNLLPVQKTEEDDRLHWRYPRGGRSLAGHKQWLSKLTLRQCYCYALMYHLTKLLYFGLSLRLAPLVVSGFGSSPFCLLSKASLEWTCP